MAKVIKKWTPENWASWKPFGIGEQHPNNFAEVFRAFFQNFKRLGYAFRVLNRGVCDGCALGTYGMRDWTTPGIHLCNIRLRLLKLNTMDTLNEALLEDASLLERKSSGELRHMGRLPYPMVRRKGDSGFRRISWEEAYDIAADRIARTSPKRMGFYLTSRGIPNETYYATQKAVRALGTNSIDNAARVCHSPSTGGLKAALGVGATTCSYSDWIDADMVVFFGTNPANNQPVTTKYMHYAKKAGTKIVTINTYREPGMENYWIPSIPESALFGTKLTDRFFLINIGGDIAFINGTIKHMIENGWLNDTFVSGYTADFDTLKASIDAQSWEELEAISGASMEEMRDFAEMVGKAEKAVFVWAMGITQHRFGEDNVKAIINLALTRGFVGKPGSGLMPIRGHSGVQGGAEMGAYSTVFPGGKLINEENAAWLTREYGFEIRPERGLTAPEMIDAAAKHDLDVLFSAGGNFVEVLPDPNYVEAALSSIPLRIHMDIVLSPQMFIPPKDTILLLPAATRYEIRGGVTETSTERRVIFSPEIKGYRPGDAKPEYEVLIEIISRVYPELIHKIRFEGTVAIREEIARVIPYYDGIQNLKEYGDSFQYGGAYLAENWNFPTSDGKAHFTPVDLPTENVPEGAFVLTTRRGKQFNSIVHEHIDQLNGAPREAVLISPIDAKRLNLKTGDPVMLHNITGTFYGRTFVAPVKPGNLQVHWPEGNVLIDHKVRSPIADIPDYNAVVWLDAVDWPNTSVRLSEFAAD